MKSLMFLNIFLMVLFVFIFNVLLWLPQILRARKLKKRLEIEINNLKELKI